MRPTLPSLVLLASLAGCKLIDQTTFAPAADQPDATQIASLPPVQSRTALLSIGYAKPNPDYGDALRTAVAAAEAGRPNTLYDVVTVVPISADPAVSGRDLARGRQDATGVMRAMMALGVPASRISLGARPDAAIKVREVRVYVR